MKADSCGTWIEQKRHKVQWLTSSERRANGLKGKCGDCGGRDTNHGTHCKTHDFATRAGAVCGNFIQRTAEDV